MNQTRERTIVVAIGLGLLLFAISRGVITERTVVFLGVLIPSIILHEVSHGWVALGFGDETAKEAGRLTLNPLAHVDVFGTLILPAMLVLAGSPAFGYAKPVPVNPRRMRDPRNHSLVVSLAGPATNLALTVVATVAYRLLQPGPGLVRDVLLTAGLANVVLAVFNLIPLPPLDGSAVVERFLPRRWWPSYLQLRRYSFLILFGLFFLVPGLFGRIIDPAINAWARFLT